MSDSRQAGMTGTAPRTGHRFALLVVALLLLHVLGAWYFVAVYAPDRRAAAVAEWRGRLGVMAEDRRQAVQDWVGERLADARLIAGFPTVEALVASGRRRGDLVDHAQQVLAAFVRSHPYRAVCVLSGAGELLASGPAGTTPDAEWRALAGKVAAAGAPVTDLYRRSGGGVSAVVVLPAEAGSGTGGRSAGTVAGAVLLEVDAAAWLYPFLGREPAPSETRETALVRREGADVEYLNPLRHTTAPPLTLRRPLDTPGLAAAAALLGGEEFGSYVDYRGVPVIAAVRAIRGTPWALIVKVDRVEVFQAARSRTRQVALAAAAILLALWGLVFGLWRDRRARYERVVAVAEKRAGALLEQARDVVILAGADGTIIDCNRAALRVYGYTREEARRLHFADLRAPGAADSLADRIGQAASPDGVELEAVHRRSDGTTFPVEISARGVELDGRTIIVAVIRDISERKQAEARVARLNRLLRTISEINELMLRRPDRQQLLAEACRIAVEAGGFVLAWVGLAEPRRGVVERVAAAGPAVAYLGDVRVELGDTPLGRGPTGTAVRENRTVVANDWERDGTVAPWRSGGRSHGLRSSAAVPLRAGERVLGAFNVYSGLAGVFDAETIALLEELAGDIGYALQAIEVEEERQAARRALRESEERFTLFMDSLPALAFIKDAESRLIYTNRAMAGFFGFQDAIGRSTQELVPRPLADSMVADDRRALERGLHVSVESVPGRDGVLHAFQTVKFAIPQEGAGRLLGGIALDITELRRAESALRESEERLNLALESTGLGLWDWDLGTGALTHSERWAAMLGYRLDELAGEPDPWRSRVHPDDLPEALAAMERHVRGETALYEHEHRLRTKSGEWIWVLDRGRIVSRDGAGRPLRIIGTQQDITARRAAEEAHSRLIAAVDQAAEAIVITDVLGTVQYVNPAFTAVSGYTFDEAVGKNPRILQSGRHDARFYRAMWETLARGEVWQGRLVNRRKEGTLFEEEATISPVRDRAGKVINYVAVKRDVTAEVRLEEQLRHAQKMEALGRVAGGVAHDFNNLLQAMLTTVQVLELQGTAPEAGRSAAVELEELIKRGASLARQLLLFARRSVTRPERLDLNELVHGAVRFLRRLLRDNVRVEEELTGVPLPIDGDHGQLEQVLTNLVVNASDAMPGGGTLRLRTGATAGGDVWFEVADDGVGMSEDVLGKIFEPFFTTKPAGKGTGLGLAVVHGIVAQHGGQVEVTSEPGRGSCFRVTLPRRQPVPVGPERGPVVPAESIEGGGETILVVEDNADVRRLLTLLLERLGYSVTAVASGEEAGLLPGDTAFDLLVTDVMLPGANGVDVAIGLRERWPGLAVILVSGYAEDEVLRQDVATGRFRFLQKPIDIATLAREVRAALGGRPA